MAFPSRKQKTTAAYSPSKWRFDAVDLRAGLAFANWRPDAAGTPQPEEGPLLHFGPPSFAPEPVANLALALGTR